MSALTTLLTTTLMIIGAVSVVKRLKKSLSSDRQGPSNVDKEGQSTDPDIVEMRKNPDTGSYEAKE